MKHARTPFSSFSQNILKFLDQPGWIKFLAAFLVVLVLALPVLVFVFKWFTYGGRFSLGAFEQAFTLSLSYRLIFTTILLAAGSALLAFCAGLPLGFLLCEWSLPLRRVFLALLIFPLCVPPYLWALGWEFILGRRGYLDDLLWEGTGDATANFLFSLPGGMFLFGLYCAGVVTLSVFVFLRTHHSGFTPGPHISWGRNFLQFLHAYRKSPVAWAAFLLVFTIVFREFGATALLGLETSSTEIFSFFSAFYSYDSVAALGLMLTVVAALLWAVWEWGVKDRMFLQESSKRKVQLLEFSVLWKTAVFWGLLFILTALYIFPFWIFLVRSSSLEFYWEAIREGGGSALRSLSYGLLSSAVIVGIALVFARFFKEAQNHWAGILEKLLAFLFFIPSILIGVLLNKFWYHWWGMWIYTTFAIVMLGIATQYLYPVLWGQKFSEHFLKKSESHPEAGRPQGSRAGKWLSRITKSNLWVLGLIILILSLRESDAAILLFPPGKESLLIKIFTSKSMETEPFLASLVIFYLILVGIPFALLAARLRKI